MKTLILCFFIFSLSNLQPIFDRPNVNRIDFALNILNISQKYNKSLCILSNDDSSISSDQSYFKKLMKEIYSQYAGSDDDIAEDDSEIIIQRYNELLQNKHRCIDLLSQHLIPDDCRVGQHESTDLSKLLIDNLISKKNELRFLSIGDILAIACVYEMFYKELIEYSGFANRNEQLLIDIFVFNLMTMERSANNLHSLLYQELVKHAHELMSRALVSGQVPGMRATICLISKSFDSYKQNELKSTLRYYITIVNELKNNESETCDISNLQRNRREKLVDKLNAAEKLDEILIRGIFLGFQQFYEYMDNSHMYIEEDLYPQNYAYISRQCNFDRQQFLYDYPNMIIDIFNNLNSESNNRLVEDLVKYCVITNIRNNKEVNGDHTMLSKLDEIINAYNNFTYSFYGINCQIDSDSCHKTTLNNLRRDSEEIDLINRNVYQNKLILYCKVQSHEYKNQNNRYLDILYKFVYKYTYSFCPHKLSNLELFADGISQDLFGIRNNKVISFRSIENFVSNFLDQSDNSINVTWFSGFEYHADYCHINKTINYSLINFEDNIVNNTNYNKIMENILQKCSLIHSIAKYVDDFNSNVDLADWLFLLETGLDFTKNVSYISLTENEKFNALKNSISDNLIDYGLLQGRQKRMDCEIERIIKKGLGDLSIDTMTGIYLHLAYKYSNSNCLLDTRMFKKKKIPESLVAYTKLYPSFEVLDDNKIRAYIIFLHRIILNVSNQLLSYDYPDMLAFKLVDPVSCTYQKTSDELNTIVLTYLENKYKDTETLWMNHVHFYKCLLLKDSISFLNELYNNNQLSSKEIENITNLYHSTLAAHPNLNEKNEKNRAAILELLTNTSKLIDYGSNKIKLSMVYCYIRKLHTIIIIDSTSSTEESSTTDMIFNQSSMTSIITSVSESSSTMQSAIKPELGKGAIAGIVIGIIAIILIFVCLMIYYFYVYRRKN